MGDKLVKVTENLRHNFDIYITMLAATTVGVMSFFNFLPSNQVNGLLLAVLVIISINSIRTREAIAAQSSEHLIEFLSDFPSTLIDQRAKSNNSLLIGVSLSRTIDTSFGAFERILKQGGKIRIVVANPAADVAAIDARSIYHRPHPDDIREEIRVSLRMIARLRKYQGLEVRTTRAALKFGVNYLDISKWKPYMHVQMYSFHMEGESRPMFELTPSNNWYKYFKDQTDNIWNEAEPCDLSIYADSEPGPSVRT